METKQKWFDPEDEVQEIEIRNIHKKIISKNKNLQEGLADYAKSFLNDDNYT